MGRPRRPSLLAGLWLLVGCGAEAPDPRFQHALQWTEEHLAEWNVPGAAVAVVEEGELRHVAGVGFRQLGRPEAVGPDTVFRVGSLSKLVTGVLTVRAVQDGLLDPEAPASEALPGLSLADPEALSSFTLGHLLSHGSGLQSPGVPNSCGTEPEDLDQVLEERVPDWDLWVPPDTLWNYSNGNYLLVGTALREATGEHFEDLVRAELFDALGLDRATYQPEEVWAGDNWAMGHVFHADTRRLEGFRDLDDRACTASFSTGGLMASARDMGRIMELLLSGGAPWLDAEGMGQLTSGGWAFSETAAYNNGLLRTEYREHRAWQHGGTVGGYLATMWLLPDEGLGVLVLVNADHSLVVPPEPRARPPDRLAARFLDTFLGLEESQWEDNTRPVEEWGRYVGTYRSEHDWGTLTVALEEGTLVLTEDDGTRRELLPYSRDRFQFPRPSSSDTRTLYEGVKFVQEGERTEWLQSGRGIAGRVEEDSGAP